MKNTLMISAGVFLALIVLSAILADVLPIADPLQQDATRRLLAPGDGSILGTDNFGRDVFSRLVHGARSSLFIAVASISLSAALGAALGTFSGYRGGWMDQVIQRAVDTLLGFPILVLAIIFIVAAGPSAGTVTVAIAVGVLPQIIRLARSQTLSVKEEAYVVTPRAMGLSPWRIVWRHILPKTLSSVLVFATGLVGLALILESALHFLGLGVPPPEPSWGGMLDESRAYLEVAPWLAIFPGLILSLTAFSFVFLGDALRDRIDPRTRPESGAGVDASLVY
jgi:ABC-type dipeptide/oligopeptide/nickel transport system permease subunit